MSNVRTTSTRGASTTAVSGCAALIGIALLLISVGPLFLLLNGGYSIQGMAWLSAHTGEYGRLFWAAATFWTVDVPIAERAGLPLAQPVLPWLMVGGISFLEIGLFLRKMRGGAAEWWIDGGGAAASLFDFTTTAIGLMFAPFAASAPVAARVLWYVLAIGLAAPLTFGFEGLLARALRGR
jgi:hypothetical protein